MKVTARDLPLAIKSLYRTVYWQQFWSHHTRTPIHLWEGRGLDVEEFTARYRTVLCGKVIANDGSMKTVTPEQATYLCKGCMRVAVARTTGRRPA